MAYSLNPLGQSRLHDYKAPDCELKRHVSQYKPSTNEHLARSSSMSQFKQKNNILPLGQMNQMSNQINYDCYPMQMPTPSNRYRDYFEERTNKFEDLAKKNFDGGQQFFKVQDAYYQKKQK